MGNWCSCDTDHESVKEVEDYCQSIIFIRFYGQTSKTKGETDKPEAGTVLGVLLKRLDEIVRQADPRSFKIDDEIRDELKSIAKLRACASDCDSENNCYGKLLKDAEKFASVYRSRGTYSQKLPEECSPYWGTRQQLLFGKVAADWIYRNIRNATQTQQKPPTKTAKKAEKEPLLKASTTSAAPNAEDQSLLHDSPMDPIFGVLLNPTGGRVGAGDGGVLHEYFFDNNGPFAYHSAVHDAFGYLKTHHKCGPGYNYLNRGFFGDRSPFGGQFSGLSFWKEKMKRIHLENVPLEKFALE